MDRGASDVTATIINALNQSQALVKELEQKSRSIDSLTRENERLRGDAAESSKKLQEVLDLLERNFKKEAEQHALIERLKQQVAQYTCREHLPSPQANSRSSTPGLPPCRPSHLLDHRSEVQVPSSSPLGPPRKRARSSSPWLGTPDELRNVEAPTRKAHTKDRSDRGVEAIPTVAEDGEDHNHEDSRKPRQRKFTDRDNQKAHQRLDTLLSDTPPRQCMLLLKPDQRSTKQKSLAASWKAPPFLRKSSSDVSRNSTAATEERPRTRFLQPKRHSAERSRTSREPLRCRGLSQLNLSHFRLNPNVDNDYYFISEEALRSKEDMEMIAATLGPRLDLSDDDLLMQMLGPGSEARIRTMTAVAKQNLVEEARASKVAELYGKKRRSTRARAPSPTGIWNSDMPGSQEAKKNRVEARRREREEIERRYQEACKQDGRWTFADE